MASIALYLTGDLFFSSRVVSAGAAASVVVEVIGSAEAARDRAAAGDVGLLIIDLTMPGCRPGDVLKAWNSLASPPPVIAYGPHVAELQLQAAREAGCTAVLTRGQFDRQIREVLLTYLESDPAN